jgi:hypothetical protein
MERNLQRKTCREAMVGSIAKPRQLEASTLTFNHYFTLVILVLRKKTKL